MNSSIALYDALAPRYEEFFSVPHRRAYDDLAWELARALLPDGGGVVVDAGCGNGRWAPRILALGHEVVGIDHAPAMAAAARSRRLTRFAVIEDALEGVALPAGVADVVLALGSLQYTQNPVAMIARFAEWTRPRGSILVLVDSRKALGIELARGGKHDEARRRLASGVATFVENGHRADHHLLDRASLETAFRSAGLVDVRSHGLLVGASVLDRQELARRLTTDWPRQLAIERRLAQSSTFADLGKQLLVYGHRPA